MLSTQLDAEEAQAIVEQENIMEEAKDGTTEIDERRIDLAEWGNELADVIEHYPEERHADYEMFIATMLDKKMGIGFIERADLKGFKRQYFRAWTEWAHYRGKKYGRIDRMFATHVRPLYYMMLSGSVEGKERRLHWSMIKEMAMGGLRKKKQGLLERVTG